MSNATRYSEVVLFDANKVGALAEIPCLQYMYEGGFDVLAIPDGARALLDRDHPWAKIAADSLNLLVGAHRLETLTVVGDSAVCAHADHAAADLRKRFNVIVRTHTPVPKAEQEVACALVLCADGRQYCHRSGILSRMLPALYLPSTAAIVIPGGPHLVARTEHGHLVRQWHEGLAEHVPIHGLCHETCAMYAATGTPFAEQRAAFEQDAAKWRRTFNHGSSAGVVTINEHDIVTSIQWHE